jgi:hypothetical protein
MQSPENAMTFHEAALANFNGYNLGSLAAPGTEQRQQSMTNTSMLTLSMYILP